MQYRVIQLDWLKQILYIWCPQCVPRGMQGAETLRLPFTENDYDHRNVIAGNSLGHLSSSRRSAFAVNRCELF